MQVSKLQVFVGFKLCRIGGNAQESEKNHYRATKHISLRKIPHLRVKPLLFIRKYQSWKHNSFALSCAKIQYLNKSYTGIVPKNLIIFVICQKLNFPFLCHLIHSNSGRCSRSEGEGHEYCFSIMIGILCDCKQRPDSYPTVGLFSGYFFSFCQEEWGLSLKKHTWQVWTFV